MAARFRTSLVAQAAGRVLSDLAARGRDGEGAPEAWVTVS